MKTKPTPNPVPPSRDDPNYSIKRALQLSRLEVLPKFTMEERLARIPNDWGPDEPGVDEFLDSLRKPFPTT